MLAVSWAVSGGTSAIGDRDFLLDGQPFVIRSGEMHYPRVPREYWGHRLRMIRALGLNTVSTYLFWSEHEPRPGRFGFTDNLDVAEFCRQAQQEGLKVIVRPGPYVCAEWDMGGLPWWLLKRPDGGLRSRQPAFLEPAQRYLRAVGEELAPLQVTQGGPIILVQVENEYDGFGRDKEYIGALRGTLEGAGFQVPFFTSEMGWALRKGASDGLFRTVSGNSRDVEKQMAGLRAFQPEGPLMCGEYYLGWFDSWGRSHATSGPDVVKPVDWMLSQRISFNLYMVHGGTSFGFASGANDNPFRPQPTSYDYDAPISEAGWATPKYHALRELIAKRLGPGERLPEIPPRHPVIAVPSLEFAEVAPLLEFLPKPRKLGRPRCMEACDQAHGCILYRTTLPKGGGEKLEIREVHDFGLVFLDGKRIATLDRGRKQNSLKLPARDRDMTLDLLVEAMGRVNYGDSLSDRKGITERVDVVSGSGSREQTGWEAFSFPLNSQDLLKLKFKRGKTDLPAYYRSHFDLKETGDTFLDLRTWGKGVVWVNGHNLGRFWRIGPQQTLYCPGPWLKKGRNELIVLELTGAERHVIAGLKEPVLDQVRREAFGPLHRQPGQRLDLTGISPIHAGALPPGKAWQTVRFAAARGRYFCLEAIDSHAGDEYATCAELSLLGAGGEELPREGWQIVHADSEEVLEEAGSADNMLDGQAESFWHTQWGGAKPKHPHQIVIDLGREETVTGLRYLPRQDQANGRINRYRLFLSSTPLKGL